LPPAQRGAFLDDACAADTALRAEIDDLLACDATVSDPLGDSVAAAAEQLHAGAPWQGRRVGNYRIVGELGRGGMGSVYLAERADAEYEAKVAIKLIRGFPTRGALERLRRERQLLASLEHPHIARLLDGGTTADGQPYLVMEYVDGMPLADWLTAQQPRLEQRLRLFQQLCVAVHYAHQNLIVHRDLKPANVLVRADGSPALLDFGIARLSAQSDAERATELRAFTPEYASPEQLTGMAVTTASDVYALGLILYEMLCGQVYAHGGKADSWRQARPGRVARAAPHPWLRADASRIDGDLEHVVRRTLAEEPARRYPSAAALAEDIERYFNGHALAAGPDRVAYRMAKFVRRHRVGVAISALALVAIVAAASWLELERTRALRAERQARLEAASADRVTDFLTGLFESADPEQTRGREVSARELLDQARTRLHTGLSAEPQVRARLLLTLGQIYTSIGRPRDSIDLLDQAVALLRQHGVATLDLARALNEKCRAAAGASDYNSALAACREAMALRRAQLAPGAVDLGHSHNALGVAEQGVGDFDAAAHDYHAALAIFSAAGPTHAGDVASTRHNLGYLAFHRGQYARARDEYAAALALKRAFFGDKDPRTLNSLDGLAQAEQELGDLSGAERDFSAALAVRIQVLGSDSVLVARSHNNLAGVQQDRGAFAAAGEHYRAALDLYSHLESPDSLDAAVTSNNLATLYEDRGDYVAALPLLQHSLRIRAAHYKPPHPSLARVQNNLARCELELGDLAAARPLIDSALAMRYALKLDAAQLLDSQLLDVQWQARSGRLEQAAAALRDLKPPDGRGNYGRRARFANVEAELAAAQHHWPAALAAQRRALDALRGELGEKHPAYARFAAQAAAYAHAAHDDAAARSLLQPALPILKAALVARAPQWREAQRLAAELNLRQ
jgi:serine/threonine-protein kinase